MFDIIGRKDHHKEGTKDENLMQCTITIHMLEWP